MVFSNGTEGEIWQSNWCDRCVHRWKEMDDGPCEEFTSAYFGEMPDILAFSETAPLGIVCRKFERDGSVA